jgi:predicted acyltransferase
VDVLRGVTIAGMIVVNDPGTWAAVYAPLRHAEWHGWTYTDTIFPFFLFLVGVSMALSFSRRREGGASPRDLARHALVRGAIVAAIGLTLNVLSYLLLHGERLRFPGVLQRIGLCIAIAGPIAAAGRARAASIAAAVLLAGYAAILSLGPLGPGDSIPARVDRAVFGSHTWKPEFDPEGLLSTLPAAATTLLGAIAGERLRRGTVATARAAGEIAVAGTAVAAAGWAWGLALPVNKTLWTPSYALLTAGLAALALAAAIGIVDLLGARRWAAPFLWLGRNAIAAFVLSTLGAILLLAVKVDGGDGRRRSLWSAIYRIAFDHFADPRLSSLLFALAYLAVWIAVCGVLYRRRIFFKI